MNYLIWKGKDSRNIAGLIISELPPITKPQMRVAETVVDGVDGSIIEELGYASYDKTLTIGLTRNAVINEVIEYFTGSGDVVFSNEADKYYKASIINQIDYARLVRFRVATVTFRVQPFKYEYHEAEESLIAESIENTSITFTNDNKKLVEIGVYGDSTQNGTPSPTAPVEIESTGAYNEETGKYDIVLNFNDDEITISLDEPLRSLPNGIKDIAHIRNNKLYVDRYVGSVLLNGSEEWSLDGNIGNLYRYKVKNSFLVASMDNSGMSNYFKYEANYQGTEPHFYLNTVGSHYFFSNISTLNEFETWLSTHNVQVDYELATPITEEYEDLTVLELLEGENNINNSENAKMIVSYIDDKLLVTNCGNYVAKPVFEIEGAGVVEVTLNGNKLFRYTFPDGENAVVVDSQKQDAYLGAVLKNRNMVGEFPTFAIGENTITWEGAIASIKISSKSRWL